MAKIDVQGDGANNTAVGSDNQPVLQGGVARTTNPTAAQNGYRANFTSDKLGRQLMVPYQMRELISTGSSALTRVSETTIISGVASNYLDLIYVTGTNATGVAVQVNLRYGTGGAIIDSMMIAANSVAEKRFTVPMPMTEVAQAITAQTTGQPGEISDSPITITMLAIQNT